VRSLALIAIMAAGFPQTLESVLAATPTEQIAGPRNLPADVRDFIGRRANCNYWLSEETSYAERTELGEDDYDSERAAQIQSALKRLRCSDVTRDEAALRQRYARNQALLSALQPPKP
jgi:hypothetical protein